MKKKKITVTLPGGDIDLAFLQGAFSVGAL